MITIRLSTMPPRYRKVAEAIMDGATRPCDIAVKSCVSRETTQVYLREMRQEGYIKRVKRGCYALDCMRVLP